MGIIKIATTERIDVFQSHSDKFEVVKRGRKTQRLLSAMKKRGSIKNQSFNVPYYKVAHFDSDNLVRHISQMHSEIMRHWNEEGQSLVIGREEFLDIVNDQNFPVCKMSFNIEAYNGYEILGLKIIVVPWMSGMVILPKCD